MKKKSEGLEILLLYSVSIKVSLIEEEMVAVTGKDTNKESLMKGYKIFKYIPR